MNKKILALTSLLSAIPAAVLVVVLAMALLSHFGDMPGMFAGIAAVGLLASGVVVFLPIGIFLFVGREASPVMATKGAKAKDEAGEEALDDDVDQDAEVEAAPATGLSTGEMPVVEGQFTEDSIPAFEGASDDNIEAFDQPEDDDEFAGFEIPDEDEENA